MQEYNLLPNIKIHQMKFKTMIPCLFMCGLSYGQCTQVKDIFQGADSAMVTNIVAINGTTFFLASDGVNGDELWKSDRTEAGTMMVKDINPGAESSIGYPPSFTKVNETLYFVADNGTNGKELWSSDGTSVGTTIVQDIQIGAIGSQPSSLTNVNGVLFFSANDGTTGRELWKFGNGSVSSISQLQANEVAVYPNPSIDFISIEINDELINSNYSLYDQSGRLVLSGELNDHINRIEMNHLKNGFYYVKVGTQHSLKIVKN